MKTTQNRTILLISNEPGRLENLSSMLQQIGYNVLSACNGREGFRLIRRKSPDLVISEMNLSGISALELCSMIRTDRDLWTTPLMFISESRLDSKNVVEILDAGADECLTEFSNPYYLAAKATWLIKRKHSENYLLDNYEILRSRQMHITEIIKNTSNLFTMSELEHKAASLNESNSQEFGNKLSQRIDLGMNMINALANLLEEQVNALEIWGQARYREELPVDQEFDTEKSELNYECITYNLIDNNVIVH